ncbi:MAG: DNA mismatch repair endonuclease MutL [Nitrospirota bacterium]
MPSIKILPVHVRNRIAAGEVIERPASVVKELVENSIDALSTEINIDVLYGGKRLIRVSDNGIGMDREDSLLCFERYATSKLNDESDLLNIKTMGFRGEALSSIASVSRVRLFTALRGHPLGVSIEIHGGDVKEVRDSSSSGTIIEVRDLFFNTPVRKKFLKSHGTELFHVIDVITKEALSHWGISFGLTSDNKETIILPFASGPKERIMQVYGDEFLNGLMELDVETEGMRMDSFISKSNNFRNSRSHQYIFINNRPVRDQSVSHAVYKAYEGILPRDQHPVFFLYLYIDPQRVDFNVHPTKREVRFENKDSIYRFVNSHIRDAIKNERAEYAKQFSEMSSDHSSLHTVHSYELPESLPLTPSESLLSENLEFVYRPFLPFIYLGDTFVAISGKGGLTIIDHHAAHERILFERFLKGINLDSSRLLFPKQVRLPHKEYITVLENTHILRDFGMEIDDFGHDTVIVRSLPDALKEADIDGILLDVASCIRDGAIPDKTLKKDVAARIACHSSIRGKELLTQEEIAGLISDLEETDQPDQCPHGRPTRIFFSLDDLKKMFKRK